MKKVIIMLAFVGIATFANAQAKLKFGYVDFQAVLVSMPEYAAAEKELEGYIKSLRDQLGTLEGEYYEKLKEFEEKNAQWSDPIKQAKQDQLLGLQKSINDSGVKLQEQYNKKQQEIFETITKKINASVEKVAKANGFTYVMDSSSGVLLFKPEGDDLTSMVKKDLGVTGG